MELAQIKQSHTLMIGARQLIETAKGPRLLFKFCNQTVYWLTVFGEKDDKEDRLHQQAILYSHAIVEHIALPWLETDNNTANIESVAIALRKIYDLDDSRLRGIQTEAISFIHSLYRGSWRE